VGWQIILAAGASSDGSNGPSTFIKHNLLCLELTPPLVQSPKDHLKTSTNKPIGISPNLQELKLAKRQTLLALNL
jgi:hypothetical protein